MAIPILEPVEQPDVRYHSSISQHRNTLAVMKKGEWVPISFDSIDYIDCNKVVSHKAIMSTGGDIGYNYGVGDAVFFSDKYILTDRNDTVTKDLPEWFGAGQYKESLNKSVVTNFDNASLGERNKLHLRVGLSYARADNTLEALE